MEHKKPRLFIIDDDPLSISSLCRILSGDYDVQTADSAEHAIEILQGGYEPQLVICDYVLPGMSGVEFLKYMKKTHPECVRTLLSGYVSAREMSPLLKEHVTHRIFSKPCQTDYLKIQIHEALLFHQVMLEKNNLEQISNTDPLTGLYNRRYFHKALESELHRSHRYHHHFSVLMIDLDGFKEFNDIHGHPAGDALLQKISKSFIEKLRDEDLVFRYGGDEFSIILPETNTENAYDVSDRLRSVFEKCFENEKITLSIGVSSYPHHSQQAEGLISLADKALYQSKKEGGNQTHVAKRMK